MYDRVSLLDQITESFLTDFHKEKNSAKIQCKFSIVKSSLRDNLFIFSLYSIFTAIRCILAHLRSSQSFYIFTLPSIFRDWRTQNIADYLSKQTNQCK